MIHICEIDSEANNGGCTEPHVAHILSRRLRTLPMAWSKETLKNIASILANNGILEIRCQKRNRAVERVLKRAAKGARKATKKIKFEIAPAIAI